MRLARARPRLYSRDSEPHSSAPWCAGKKVAGSAPARAPVGRARRERSPGRRPAPHHAPCLAQQGDHQCPSSLRVCTQAPSSSFRLLPAPSSSPGLRGVGWTCHESSSGPPSASPGPAGPPVPAGPQERDLPLGNLRKGSLQKASRPPSTRPQVHQEPVRRQLAQSFCTLSSGDGPGVLCSRSTVTRDQGCDPPRGPPLLLMPLSPVSSAPEGSGKSKDMEGLQGHLRGPPPQGQEGPPTLHPCGSPPRWLPGVGSGRWKPPGCTHLPSGSSVPGPHAGRPAPGGMRWHSHELGAGPAAGTHCLGTRRRARCPVDGAHARS